MNPHISRETDFTMHDDDDGINLMIHGGPVNGGWDLEAGIHHIGTRGAISTHIQRLSGEITASQTHQYDEAGAQQSQYDSIEARTATFTDRNLSTPFSVEDIAIAGFYFCGERNQVCCYRCQGTIENWDQALAPMKEHTYQFPDCPFVRESLKPS